MKTLRILMFGLAAVLFTTSSLACIKYAKEGNTEQAASAFAIASVSMAVPAVSAKDFKSVLGTLGNMGGGLTRAESHLLNYLQSTGRVDQTTYADYASGKLRFVSFNGYIRKLINNFSGVQVILDQRDAAATGITNIHQGKLDKSINAVVTNIIVGYGTTTVASGVVDPKAVNTYSSDIGGFPAGLRSAELIIKQDGNRVQDPIPVNMCGSQADSSYAFGKFDSFQLNTPIILEEQKQIVVELDLPVGSFTGTNNHFVEIFLIGSKTKVRSLN